MIAPDKEKFNRLCIEDRILHTHDGDSIGTYNEKRLHRIFKRYITEDASCYEVRLGKYVADVVSGDTVYEIQTGSFAALPAKVRYYLEKTDNRVVIIHPVICEKIIIRAERDSGEIIRAKRSPRRVSDIEAAGCLYYLSELFPNDRLSICVAHIKAEEYRFSEARRYCKEGRYDSDLRPCELLDFRILKSLEDLSELVPHELFGREFDAGEFSAITKLKGRRLYYSLNTLCIFGVLSKRQEGKRNIYNIKSC